MKEKWTKISDIEQHPDDDYDFSEIFFKGDFAKAAHYAQKKGYIQVTLTAVDPADETDPGYVKWMKQWKEELEK